MSASYSQSASVRSLNVHGSPVFMQSLADSVTDAVSAGHSGLPSDPAIDFCWA